MTQVNPSIKQKQTHRCGEQTSGCHRERGWEREGLESLGSAGANYYIQNGETARSHSGAQGTIFSIL